jgi:hypothetical protein
MATFDEKLKNHIRDRVDYYFNPMSKGLLLDKITGEHPEFLENPNVKDNIEKLYDENQEKSKEWLKDSAELFFIYQNEEQDDNQPLTPNFVAKIEKYIFMLFNVLLFSNNPNPAIKNNWQFKQKWDYADDTIKELILSTKPFVIGIGRPSNRTHNLRYNMARDGAIHRMRQKQFYKF